MTQVHQDMFITLRVVKIDPQKRNLFYRVKIFETHITIGKPIYQVGCTTESPDDDSWVDALLDKRLALLQELA